MSVCICVCVCVRVCVCSRGASSADEILFPCQIKASASISVVLGGWRCLALCTNLLEWETEREGEDTGGIGKSRDSTRRPGL